MVTATKKILLIRFSSIGDVTQCLSVASKLRALEGEIHWVTRSDLAPLLENHPAIDRVWKLERSEGFRGLWNLTRKLRAEKFTHIYDAHNNLRSRWIGFMLRFPADVSRWQDQPGLIRRSIQRLKRFFLFRFHKNFFPQPFAGQREQIAPLKKWGIDDRLPSAPQLFLTKVEQSKAATEIRNARVGLVPSAAYPLKRWPVEYWQELVRLLDAETFAVFGGPDDAFLQDIEQAAPGRVRNFKGTTLRETAALIAQCDLVIANDTGPMHFSEQLGKPTIALMGPAPFGFPSRSSTLIKERNLSCRPCSKHGQGPCVNEKFHACLRDITPQEIAAHVRKFRQSGTFQ